MDASPSPLQTQPGDASFTDEFTGYHADDVAPPSFPDLTAGRPVSGAEDQLLINEIPAPALIDVQPNQGLSYPDEVVHAENNAVAVNQDDAMAPSIEGFAGDRSGKSEYDEYGYESDKIPTQGDIRQYDRSSGYLDDFQMSAGPKSYNSNYFEKFKWVPSREVLKPL